MIAAAERRNRVAVDAGTARFVLGSFGAVDLPVDDVDRLFAARVAAMVRADELTAGWRLLRPGGVLVLSFDAPDDAGLAAILDHAVAAVTAAGFVGVRRIAASADGGAGVGGRASGPERRAVEAVDRGERLDRLAAQLRHLAHGDAEEDRGGQRVVLGQAEVGAASGSTRDRNVVITPPSPRSRADSRMLQQNG